MTTGERIGAAMARKRISYRELSKRTGLHASLLHRMVHGTQDVTTDRVVIIARGLRVRPASLLPDASAS